MLEMLTDIRKRSWNLRKVDGANKFTWIGATESKLTISDRELGGRLERNGNQVLADDSLRKEVVGN